MTTKGPDCGGELTVVDYYGNEFTLPAVVRAFASDQAEAMPESNYTLVGE